MVSVFGGVRVRELGGALAGVMERVEGVVSGAGAGLVDGG